MISARTRGRSSSRYLTMKKQLIVFVCLCSLTLLLLFYWTVFTREPPKNFIKIVPLTHNPHLFKSSLYPTRCKEFHQVVLLVTSYAGHVEVRSAHRRAMPQPYLHKFNTTRVFLLAQIPQAEKYIAQNAIDNENERFGDILQGTFTEHYRNLTFKHLMGLHWAGLHCRHAKYIIKVDDDTVFNFEKIHGLLGEYESNDKLMVGYVLNGTRPHRELLNKWYISPEEYPHAEYPPYVSGWLYITTPATAIALVHAAAYHAYFWIDDIFVTGILTAELDIKIKDIRPKNIWLEYYELLECCLRDMIERNFRCEYAVAPNGGRDNLILEFNAALRHCETLSSCKRRSDGKRLRETCVVERDRKIFGSGKPNVGVIKF